MSSSRNISSDAFNRGGLPTTLKSELQRFFLELAMICALLMVLTQTFPASANEVEACTQEGIATVQTDAANDQSKHDCERCSVCAFNQTKNDGLTGNTAKTVLAVMQLNLVEPVFAAVHIPLPDHFLPFSGAPPPPAFVEFMQYLSLSKALTKGASKSSVSGVVPWH